MQENRPGIVRDAVTGKTKICDPFVFKSTPVKELYYPTPLIVFFRRSLYIAFP